MNKKELNSLFDDAIDELEITYDVYFNIERYRPRCVHTMHRLLSSGLEGGKVLVLGSDEKPFTMMCSKLGFHADGISFNPSANNVTENENRTASSVTEIIKNIKDDDGNNDQSDKQYKKRRHKFKGIKQKVLQLF